MEELAEVHAHPDGAVSPLEGQDVVADGGTRRSPGEHGAVCQHVTGHQIPWSIKLWGFLQK